LSRRLILFALAFTLLVTTFLRPAPGRNKKTTAGDVDRDTITAVLEDQKEAWNRGDLTDFMKGYWNSPELTFAGKDSFARGWEAVLQRYKRSYPDKMSMGHLEFTDLEVRSLCAGSALVFGKWHLARTSGDVGGIFTLVFQRFSEGWRIVHDHTTGVECPCFDGLTKHKSSDRMCNEQNVPRSRKEKSCIFLSAHPFYLTDSNVLTRIQSAAMKLPAC